MIDWEETEHRFHVTTKTATRKSRVVVICPVCRSKRELILDSYKKTIALRGNAPCMSCRNKENRQKYADNYRKSDTNRAKSLAQTMKKKWEDPSYRQRQTKAINKKAISESCKRKWQDKQYRDKITKAVSQLYEDQHYYDTLVKKMRSPQNRRRLRARPQTLNSMGL